jgi:hypothetical protein
VEITRTHPDVPRGTAYRLHVGDLTPELAAALDVDGGDPDVVLVLNPDDAAAANRER